MLYNGDEYVVILAKYSLLAAHEVLILVCSLGWLSLSGVPDYFDRNKISSGGDLSHYSSASLY